MREGGTEVVSDDELLRRAQEGDTEAFNTLFGRHRPMCMSVVRRMTKEQPEDIVQEGMIACFCGLKNLREFTSFRSFLWKCVRNEALRHLRRRHVIEHAGLDGLADAATEDPAEMAEIHAELDRFKALWPKLDQRCRELLESKFVDGMSYRTIGDRMHMPKTSVSDAVARCREKFRGMMRRSA